MAASFTIAARNNGFTKAETRDGDARLGAGLPGGDGRVRADGHDGHLVRAPVRGGADGGDQEPGANRDGQGARRKRKKGEKGAKKIAAKARTRDSLQALSKLAELVDGKYRIVSQPPIVIPLRGPARDSRDVARRGATRDPRAVPRLPGHPAERPAPPAGTLRGHRRRPQGRRRRERRHAGVHRLAPRPRSTGPAVPPGQGGDHVGAGGPPSEEPVQAARRARRAGPADDAGRERHLPRLDQGRARTTATCTGGSSAT